MEFKEFALSRDLLYLFGAFAGLTLGYCLSIFRKSTSTRSANRRITLVLLFASAMLATLAAAAVVSRGVIFGDIKALLVAILFIGVFALAVRFPLAAAYPLIITVGLCTVWLALACLRFPAASQPVALVSHNGTTFVLGELPGGNEIPLPENNLSSLDFSVAVIQVGRYYPIIGGSRHVVLMEVSAATIGTGSEIFYSNNSKPQKFLGVHTSTIRGNISLEDIKPGMVLPVRAGDWE